MIVFLARDTTIQTGRMPAVTRHNFRVKGVDGAGVDRGMDRPSAYKALIEILFAIIAPLLLLLLASSLCAQAESQICPADSQLCKMSNTEQTFIMIKPDGVARGLVGEVIKRFEQKVHNIMDGFLASMQASDRKGPKYYATARPHQWTCSAS